MVDIDQEFLYVKQLLRCYDIISKLKQQNQQLQELLSKGKKDTKVNVGKSKLSDSNSR